LGWCDSAKFGVRDIDQVKLQLKALPRVFRQPIRNVTKSVVAKQLGYKTHNAQTNAQGTQVVSIRAIKA
jgi:hypothetical protein